MKGSRWCWWVLVGGCWGVLVAGVCGVYFWQSAMLWKGHASSAFHPLCKDGSRWLILRCMCILPS